MGSRAILIFVCILSIYFNTFVSSADTCVEDLESLKTDFYTNDNLLKIQETFYPQNNKLTPRYVVFHYCHKEPCTNSNAEYEYFWPDNPIFMVLDFYLFRALIFELADLGDICEQYFVVPQFCNNTKSNTEELLLALTKQLAKIGNNSHNGRYLQNIYEQSQLRDYDQVKVVITIWLIISTIGCLIIAHVLVCIEEAREHLGKLVNSFLSKYYKSIIIINKKDSSILQLKDEKIFFFFIERMAFPVMLVTAVIITSFDIYLYRKYHTLYNDKRFLYLFPVPCVAHGIFGLNFVMSVATAIKIFYWDIAENEQESIDNCKDKLKHDCQKFLRFTALVLLFGIVYLFYHGFWLITALLAYPVRILIGGIFIVPLMFVTIPIWNTIIKIAENWLDTCNESSCCINCYTCIRNCCIHCCLGIIDFCNCCCLNVNYFCIQCYSDVIYPYICCCKNICEHCKNKFKWQPFCKGCAWFVILVYEFVFWGLFIAILFYASRFLLAYGPTNLENKTNQLVLSFILTIVTVSGILAWINTDLVIHPQNNEENQNEHQQDNEESQNKHLQDNEYDQDEH